MFFKLQKILNLSSAYEKPIDLINPKSFGLAAQHNGSRWNVLARTEYVLPRIFYSFFYRSIKANDIVWVKLTSRYKQDKKSNLERFVKYALPKINQPFYLITTDGDSSVPTHVPEAVVSKLKENKFLLCWYSQNCSSGEHVEKIRALPIGFDFHTNRCGEVGQGLANKLAVIKKSNIDCTRSQEVFCDVLLNATSTTRSRIRSLIETNSEYCIPSQRMGQLELWQAYTQYSFVLSLEGNGLDCHRTWEALYLGCTVLVLSSELDYLYKGLNVYILADESELNDPDLVGRLAFFRKGFSNIAYQESYFSVKAHLNFIKNTSEGPLINDH